MMSAMKHTFLFTTVMIGLSACGPITQDNNDPAVDCVLLEEDGVNGGQTLSGCYNVESVLSVSEGLLTIEAGARFIFEQDAGLTVGSNAGLVITGTAEDPVIFEGASEERAFWKGVRLENSDAPQNSISYLTLSHAGSSQWNGDPTSRAGILIAGEKNNLEISNSTFRENGLTAIHANGGESDVTIASSSFENNDGSVWVHANLAGGLSDDLSFDGNDDDRVHTSLRGSSEVVSSEQTWPALAVPYLVKQTIQVSTLLTIAEGATFEFEQEVGVQVSGEGRLSAIGTESAPITFKGAEAERGFWTGFFYTDSRSSQNVLDHVVISDAGANQWNGAPYSRACIYIGGDGVALSISNATFSECGQAGIVAESGGVEFSVASSAFTSSDLPLWIDANLAGGLAADNTMSGNDDDYIYLGVNGASTDVTANQTWNTFDVPYRAARTVRVSGELTLSPGMTFEFDQEAGLNVDGGTLIADGSAGDRISFVAADGESIKGFWKGIRFGESLKSANKIANADILYGGSSGWNGNPDSTAGLYLAGSSQKSQVALDDVRIAGSGRWGVSVSSESSVSPCESLTLEDNGSGSEGGPAYVDENGVFACN